MDRNNWKLGDTASLFESQGDAGTISPGVGDAGGVSYGIYQFSSKAGTAKEFTSQSKYSESFKNLTPGTDAFDEAWKKVASVHSDFGDEQHQFIKATHVDPVSSSLARRGLDLSDRGPAVQDMVWSMSVQYRNRTPALIERGLREAYGDRVDMASVSDEGLVRAVQSSKLRHVNQDFASSSEAVRLGVETRIVAEEGALVRLATTGAIGTPAETSTDWRNASPIKHGSSSERIMDVQEKLQVIGMHGENAAALVPDGSFGANTKEAVKAFQRSEGLPASGVVGALTLQHLNERALARQEAVAQSVEHRDNVSCRLDDAAHPDHALFQSAQSHVHQLDQSLGRTPDQQSDNIASALTVQARYDGLQRIDQIALSPDGSKLWAVQTPPGRTDHLFDIRTCVPTSSANTPVEESSSRWPDAMHQYQQQAAEMARGQQQTQQQTQGTPQAGPSLTPGL